MDRRRARNTGRRHEDVGWWEPNPGVAQLTHALYACMHALDACMHVRMHGHACMHTHPSSALCARASWRRQHALGPEDGAHQELACGGGAADAKGGPVAGEGRHLAGGTHTSQLPDRAQDKHEVEGGRCARGLGGVGPLGT
eukprot:354060-Chlamydomonas_euryale.AAC.11